MTEKAAKKIGEAYAFAQVLTDTFTSNIEVMTELFGDHAEGILEVTRVQKEELSDIAEGSGMAEIVLQKAERTGGEMYVGDDWDDVAEVLEWMSFFVGGAIVHWQLIAGSAAEMDHDHFGNIAGVGTEYYASLMTQLREHAVEIGKVRAQA